MTQVESGENITCPHTPKSSIKSQEEIMKYVSELCISVLENDTECDELFENILLGSFDPSYILSDFLRLVETVVKKSPKTFEEFDETYLENSNLSSLLTIAIKDIYYSICLSKYHQISPQLMKGLVLRNMMYGSSSEHTINGTIEQLFRNHPNEIISELKYTAPIVKGKVSIEDADCPFYATALESDWIDRMWKLVENRLVSSMSEKYRDSKLPNERFFSGNINIEK